MNNFFCAPVNSSTFSTNDLFRSFMISIDDSVYFIDFLKIFFLSSTILKFWDQPIDTGITDLQWLQIKIRSQACDILGGEREWTHGPLNNSLL